MTDEQFIRWLKDSSAIRCVLMEVGVKTGGVEVTRYLSNRGYVTGNGDVPANTIYRPLIAGGIRFTESLSLEGSTSLSFGDIELNNVDGALDSWLDEYWNNRSVKVFIGDVTWARADFRQIFNGVVAGIDTRSRTKINIKVSDKLQRLNTPVTETKLGGTTQNKDRLLPLCFGEVHNIEPLLVDPALHEYQVHNGPIEDIIEVRDNGVPVAVTKFLNNGKFRLNKAPAGQITCSVQGDKPLAYSNNIAVIIKRIATQYGNAVQRFSDADIDQTNFSDFQTAHPQPVGIYLNDRANVLDVCNQLATSVGARLAMTKTGLLRLVKISLPQSAPGTTVTAIDMADKSLHVSSLPPVVAGVKLGYCKNYTVQNNLQTGIPAEHLDLYAQQWLTVTRVDTATASNYNLFSEPTLQETLLLVGADASNEASRRLNLYNVQRKVYKYTGFPNLLLEELGKSQTLKHERFGLANGVTGQIISLTTDWINPRVEVEVLA